MQTLSFVPMNYIDAGHASENALLSVIQLLLLFTSSATFDKFRPVCCTAYMMHNVPQQTTLLGTVKFEVYYMHSRAAK